jgi:membrane-bound metal-dependent hydrolase YbcI (DUF457 family)
MSVLIGSLTIFALGLLAHVAIWKISLPKKQTRALLGIFYGVLLLCLLAAVLSQGHLPPSASRLVPRSVAEWGHVGILFSGLCLGYIITYSAVEADSPSMLMVTAIARSGKEGLEPEVLDEMFAADGPVLSRLENLVRDGLVERQGDVLALTPRGKRFNRIFGLYRLVAGIAEGG